ncbi:MAG: AI-2E family transporter, partial [Patescibacteria group bacterium]
MNAKTLQPYFLISLIAVSSVLTFFIFRPFLVVLVLALVFAVVLQPLYKSVLRRMNASPGLAAFITMLVSLICIIIPLAFITVQIAGEAQNLYSSITNNGFGETYLNTFIESVYIEQYVKDGLEWLAQNLGGAFGGLAKLLLSLFIFLIALYYFLRDGEKLKRTIIDASPLADTDDNAVLTRLEQSVNSVIRGSLTIALIQGILTSIGFAFFGVPNFILWGVVASFAALIPGIGTSLVLVPGIAYLFIISATTPALGLLVWSV